MTKTSKVFFFFCLLLMAQVGMAQDVKYHVTIDPDNPEEANVIMSLQDSFNARELYSKATNNQTETQVSDVRCGNEYLEQNVRKRWQVPSFCNEVSWKINFVTEDSEGIAAFDQKSVLMATRDWWVVSSPSALLRLRREPFDLAIQFDVKGYNTIYSRLPHGRRPPAYFALGNAPIETVLGDGIRLTYISDDPSYTSEFVKASDHAKGLEYMAQALGINTNGKIRNITMIMLGIIRDRGVLGGAAGENAMLVNYIYKNDKSREQEKYLPILVALHEQFHQLDYGRHPVWVRESLAHYYATKAMMVVYPGNQTVKEIVDELYASPTIGLPGLVEIDRRINEKRDFTDYDNFYGQGSAFWHMLDRLIESGTDGKETLDDYLPQIMKTPFIKGMGLPSSILESIDFVPKKAITAIEEKYLYSRAD